jgi:prolipoprotein diacylglyceryltransferase
MEFTLLGAALIAVGALYGMLWWEAGRGNASECTRDLWDGALGAAVAGVFVGRLAAMIADGVNPLLHPGDILFVRAGVATGPAALTAIGTFAFLGRRRLLLLADGIAAAALAGLAGWHAGCLARGACLGTASDLPWAIAQEGSAVTRHPVEIYAAVLFLIAALALAWAKAYRRPPPGVPAALALAAVGLVRLATEPMRPALGSGPLWWYVAAVVVGAAGALAALRRKPLRRNDI